MSCCYEEKSGLQHTHAPIVVAAGIVGLYFLVCGTLTFDCSANGILIAFLEVTIAAVLFAEIVERNHPTLSALTSLGSSLVLLAILLGITNHNMLYAPYLEASLGRHYVDVPATGKALAYSDAGVIEFTKDTMLDHTRAIGLTSHGRTYCAAPILSASTIEAARDGSIPEIQFWGVGMDCCAGRGDFQCGSAGEAGAHAGVAEQPPADLALARDVFARRSNYEEYLAAVQMAAALHAVDGIKAPAQPVLVSWLQNPQETINGWRDAAISIWLLSSFLVGIIVSTLWTSTHNHYETFIKNANDKIQHTAYGGVSRGGSPMAPRDPYLKNSV
eukprot:TRINITY_DN111319_c0_g1_i1.p2 TRINITY_DN111319_c0_g1~~TRINITY_DN111319_c0_g1_i1.p2  ORF type:complete len:330 (-),score=57.14 TRINITY_DN111319_c0_g1_i1:84-1073(-)